MDKFVSRDFLLQKDVLHHKLMDEDKEITRRLHKIRRFIDSKQFQSLDSISQKMLKIQEHVMEEYHRLVFDRILYIEGNLDGLSIDKIKSTKLID